MKSLPYKILLLLIVLIACVQPTPPATRAFKTLGNLEITLDGGGEAIAKLSNPALRNQSGTAFPDNALSFTRKFSSSFDIDSSNERYISATFEVKNNSGAVINNLSLVAYNQGNTSLAGTAIKNLVNFGGTEITDVKAAQSIYPVQSLKRSGTELIVDSENADFQGFSSDEANNIGTSARNNNIIRNQDTPLEYGFVVRNGYSRSIGDGETGLVTLTLRFQRPSNPIQIPYRFVMTFVLTEDTITRVTRGINESTTEAETRAYYANASELMLIGPDADTTSNSSITTVRLSNARIGLEPTYLVKPSLFMRDLQPSIVKNDTDTTVLIRGTRFETSTAFFIQSTKLEVQNVTATEATVIIPKGFIPSKYGIMAASNNGERATLYPALTIAEGAVGRALDVRDNYKSFIDGYVFDYETKNPIAGARISIPGLETTSGNTGYFLLRGVPAGRHVVKIEKQVQQYNSSTGNYENTDTHEPLYRIANVLNNPNSTMTLKLVMLEPKTTNTTIIGSSGGIHYATSNHSTGPFIKIPAGALDKDTPIQFTHLRDGTTLPELNNNGNYLAFAHLGPTGLVFKKPATLFLPLQDGIVLNVGETINILYFDTKTGTWVDDITGGKISRINGQLFLEYEINHFTWIGGANPLPPTSFSGPTGPPPPSPDDDCSKAPPPISDPTQPPPPPPCIKLVDEDAEDPEDDCVPTPGIPTSEGISDENGQVRGSKPGSRAPQEIVISPLGYGDYTAPSKKKINPTDRNPQKLPCAIIPPPNEPYKTKPIPKTDNACGSPTVKPFATTQATPQNTPTAQLQATTTTNPLLISSNTNGFSASLGNFSGSKVNPSSIKISVGGKDVTDTMKMAASSTFYDGFDFNVTLKEPLKAQAGLEVKLEGRTLDGKVFESRVGVDIVAKITPYPIRFVAIDPDDDAYVNMMLAQGTGEDEETTPSEFPFFVEAEGEIKVLYLENDLASLQDFEIPLFFMAEDELGRIVPINSKAVTPSLTSGTHVTRAAAFENGIAEFTLQVDNPMSVNGLIFSGGLDFTISGSSQGLRLQQLTCGAISLSGAVCMGSSGTYRLPNAALTARVSNAVRTSPSNDRVSTQISQRWAQYVSQIKPISVTVQSPVSIGICLATAASTKPAAASAAKPYDMVRSNSAECQGTDTTRSVPQTRTNNKAPRSIPNKDERRAKYEIGIDVAWLQEASLVCRGDRGTRNWTPEERKKLWEARTGLEKTLQQLGCKNYGYAGIPFGSTASCTNQKYVKAFADFKDSIRQSGLYGKKAQRDADGNIKKDKKGKTLWDWSDYVGHHINSAACYDTATDVPDNISFTDRDTHINICHGGSYKNCSQGNLTDRESRYLDTEQRVPRCEATPPTGN